ncbi:CIC11C00000003322 [Sungouiella intermedia]|uniref:CIC11C00000003322 n=1 Tax=Sungouiella intermedia TaxID=45354 RepID=A0A1L0E359_9ASCO|nr:CIC11C00000003322 [[Candida] intermedia]
MVEIDVEEPLTSNVRPATDALITVRIVKSFPYRNVKNHIIHSINLKGTTPSQLLEQVHKIINTTGALRPYRNVNYDTVKVYTHAHGTKSMNLVINFDHDERDILCCENKDHLVSHEESLWDLGVENETEVSVFNFDDYEAFKANPEEKW